MTNTFNIDIENLEEVFSTFNRVSCDLETSYRDLEKQVTRLNEELATARSARLQDLTAKERLAARLSVLMDSLPGGILILDSESRVIQENPGAVEILGHNVTGEYWPALLGIAPRVTDNKLHDVILDNGRHVSIASRDYGDSKEKIILLSDTTEIFMLHKQLNRDTRLKEMGEMTARLAHQIRTPLSTAILYLSHISSGRKNLMDSPQLISRIQQRLSQVDQLVNSMLCYIKDGVNDATSFCLKDLLAEISGQYAERIECLQGSVRFHCTLAGAPYFGNRLEMFNAISNLMENAIQAKASAPGIEIDLLLREHHYLIRVKDNGPGISEADLERIFDPFFSTRFDGTGMGLAIVMSVIRAHRGEISVSNHDDGGVCFEILLPESHDKPVQASGLWHVQGAGAPVTAAKEIMHECY